MYFHVHWHNYLLEISIRCQLYHKVPRMLSEDVSIHDHNPTQTHLIFNCLSFPTPRSNALHPFYLLSIRMVFTNDVVSAGTAVGGNLLPPLSQATFEFFYKIPPKLSSLAIQERFPMSTSLNDIDSKSGNHWREKVQQSSSTMYSPHVCSR